jgi:hypothetical protein
VPVSSTVIPLPVYKVGFGVGVNGTGKKPTKPDEATKLITGIILCPICCCSTNTVHLKVYALDLSARFIRPDTAFPFIFLKVYGKTFKGAIF